MKYLATLSALRSSLAIPRGEPYIIILGPYHRIWRADEGWVSRVRAIDYALHRFHRVYVNFSTEGKLFLHGRRPTVFSTSPWIAQYNLDAYDAQHTEIFARLMDGASACYAHNLHLAEHALPWVASGKVVTDMHGAVPEEEALLGNPDRAAQFADVERRLVMKSQKLVVVSNALACHLRAKYPESGCEFIRVPICEPLPPAPPRKAHSGKLRLVYCGSDHAWQNVPDMLRLAHAWRDRFDFHLYSHRHAAIARYAADARLAEGVKFGAASKAELTGIYAHSDLGFILRDDNIVNRVACPTKLYEYLHFGVVPIVRSPEIGDFIEYGYDFITEFELTNGIGFNRMDLAFIASLNQRIARALESDFISGCSKISASLL